MTAAKTQASPLLWTTFLATALALFVAAAAPVLNLAAQIAA